VIVLSGQQEGLSGDLLRKGVREELAAGVKVSIRASGVRVACRFFNTEEDLERLLEASPDAITGRFCLTVDAAYGRSPGSTPGGRPWVRTGVL